MFFVARALRSTRARVRGWSPSRGFSVGSGLAALSLAGAFGCGGAEGEGEPPCELTGECVVAGACRGAGCGEASPPAARPIEGDACVLVTCPQGGDTCCTGAVASATGNGRQLYQSRPQMVSEVRYINGELRVDYSFDSPNQQGWVKFALSDEMDLSRLEFWGRPDGVADRFLVVNTNQADGGGCSFGFDVEPRPTPLGTGAPFLAGSTVPFANNLASCFDRGTPGRASELAFAIFANGQGTGSLIISNITLRAE
jgi:hypothetical protein